MLIGLTGPAGSGKSTVAKILSVDYGYARRPFAYHLKAMIGELGVPAEILDGDSEAKSKPLPQLGGHSTRYALQCLGTEWGRECMGQDFWVKIWLNGLEDIKHNSVVADDVRFANEAYAIQSRGGVIIEVRRELVHELNADEKLHASEQRTGIEPDYVLHNNFMDRGVLRSNVFKLFGEIVTKKEGALQ